MRNRTAVTVIFVLALALAGSIIPSKFTITRSPSLRHRVFYLDKSPAARGLKRGDYVVFTIQDRRVEGGKKVLLTKEIGCAPGDTLSIQGRDYYCNGANYLGKAKETTLNGERLSNFIFNGTVPEGKIFVAGHHKDSFDSRYFGFIDTSDITAKAYPVF